MGFGGSGFMFDVFPILFVIVFCLIAAAFAVTLFKSVHKSAHNSRSPVLSVRARVVSRRDEFHGRHDMRGYTDYFATFEVESGDRMELSLSGEEYGLLAEGDVGKLTFQGAKFVSFDRD